VSVGYPMTEPNGITETFYTNAAPSPGNPHVYWMLVAAPGTR